MEVGPESDRRSGARLCEDVVPASSKQSQFLCSIDNQSDPAASERVRNHSYPSGERETQFVG